MTVTAVPEPRPGGFAPPWTTAGHADPNPWFHEMARERPVARDPLTGIWHFAGYDQVHTFLRDWETWSTAKRLELLPPEQRVVRLLTSEPPLHVELRERFRRAYRPTRVRELEARIQSVCSELLDECLAARTFDLVSQFAAPLTATLIAGLIGIDVDERERLMALTSSSTGSGRIVEHDADAGADGVFSMIPGTAAGGNKQANTMFAEVIAQRRTCPRDDLVSDLAAIPPGEFTGNFDIGALLVEQLGAGQSTTTHLIGSIVYLLGKHPDQAQRLRDDPTLVPSAIEETLRLSSPVQARPRVSTHETIVDGVTIPKGASGLAWLQAANLDPRHFDDPLRFDVGRSPNHHVAFGFGEHFCLGAPLARLEAQIVLAAFLQRVDDFTIVGDGPQRWNDDFLFRGPRELRIEVNAA